jgi:pimeloyl-ACP methyl ester carboxylesterase
MSSRAQPIRSPAQSLRRLSAVLLLVCAHAVQSGCCALHRPPVLPMVFCGARTLDGIALPPQRDYWTAFRNPSKHNATGLYLLEPYQPGRIPLVLIHGLASDALTWDETIKFLYSNPDVVSRYQIWCYQYPTGRTYLQSASELRKELIKTRELLDPGQTDPAFDQMVLVGHSMGGLIARLQVSYSDDALWRAVSDMPLSTVFESGPLPDETVSALLFEPVPFVKKVVYIATPQRGSNWTQSAIGRIGRWLIDVPEQVEDEYTSLIRGRPGLIRNATNGPPTSIDHLYPGNSVMQATSRLRPAMDVSSHSIIGTGYLLPDFYLGDGVVAIASARIPDVRTEYFVNATHSRILENRAAFAQLACILTRMP